MKNVATETANGNSTTVFATSSSNAKKYASLNQQPAASNTKKERLNRYTSNSTQKILLSSYLPALLAQRMRWLKKAFHVGTAAVETIAAGDFR